MNVENNPVEWIRLADMDMATASHMYETYHPKPVEIVCFHAQQSAEKMMKCFLVSRNIEPPKTHNMRLLCELCIEIEKKFDDIFKDAVLLSRYGVVPRYPAEVGLTEQDAEKAIEYAKTVMTFVNNILSQEKPNGDV